MKYMPMLDYRAAAGISKSQLDNIHRSPAHFKYLEENPEEPTPPMVWGTMFHSFVLEPDTFNASYAVLEDKIDKRTKEGKAAWEEWQLANLGKMCIDKPTMQELVAMRDSLMSNDRVKTALSGGVAEGCLFWKHGSILAKARPDYVSDNMIFDLKTCLDARPDAFSKQCWNFRYHVQAAYYSDGYEALTGDKPDGFMFIAIEKAPPYASAIYIADEAMVDQGRHEYQQDLEVYSECLANDNWPAYPDIVQALVLPRWAQEDYVNGY